MAKCKDCLHHEACSAFSKIISAAVDVERGCEHFKDHANVVPVVRCKDCQSFEEQMSWVNGYTGNIECCGYCYHWNYEPGSSPNQVDGDDYCSYGERR